MYNCDHALTKMASPEVESDVGKAETDINMRLIYLVRENTFIFDAQDPNYKDRELRERTWFSIAAQINVSVEEAKTKWQRLRNNFSKAVDRRGKTPRSGSAATKLQKPWMYEADMEFIRGHLSHHRNTSSYLKRRAPASDVSQSFILSPQQRKRDVPEQCQQFADAASTSDSISLGSTNERDSRPAPPKLLNVKARRQDLNDLDSDVLCFIKESSTKIDQEEDPAIGWFKSLLPMFNTLSPIEKLEFQSKMALELRDVMLSKQ